jgi:hypothetical protein
MLRSLPCRDSQRGNVMLLVLLALVGLAAVGGITALSVTRSGHAASHDRFKAIALYAAESGAASAMDFLRRSSVEGTSWSTFVTSNNSAPLSPTGIAGNMIAPGEIGNPFSDDEQAWYEVALLNNPSDPQLAAGEDGDHRLIIRSTGHGPDGAVARIEWEIQGNFTGAPAPHCPAYGQRGMAEDDAGRNDCLTQIDASQTATYSPGGH